MEKIYLYTRFERFWHWLQGGLIILLIVTGFEIHSTFTLFGFENAFNIHNYAAWTWLILFIFIVFWLIITGEWKQYIPTMKKMIDVILYYSFNIFKGHPHPVPKSKRRKHNPLQRITYLVIVSLLIPYQIITGFLYYYYNELPKDLFFTDLAVLGALHTIGAFAFVLFLIIHIYMTTTGHTWTAHIKAMFTGWEEVENINEVEPWEIKSREPKI